MTTTFNLTCDFCGEEKPCRRIIGGVMCQDCWTNAFPFEQLPPAYPSELTPAGEQTVIPGCERQPVAGKPAQLSLFGG